MVHGRHTRLITALVLIILPARLNAQEPDRENVLAEDIQRLGERAVRDMVISEEERSEIISFVRDSLPENTELKVQALEVIRDKLDEKYAVKTIHTIRAVGYMYQYEEN